jgi:hypothetical protein
MGTGYRPHLRHAQRHWRISREAPYRSGRAERRGAAMIWVSAIVLVSNVVGAALMAKYGLPSAVPFIGRRESDDSVLGMLGLVLFVTSLAVRITAVITGGGIE